MAIPKREKRDYSSWSRKRLLKIIGNPFRSGIPPPGEGGLTDRGNGGVLMVLEKKKKRKKKKSSLLSILSTVETKESSEIRTVFFFFLFLLSSKHFYRLYIDIV